MNNEMGELIKRVEDWVSGLHSTLPLGLRKKLNVENGTVLFFKRAIPRFNVLLDDRYSPFPCEYIPHTNTNIRLSFLNEGIPYFLKAPSKVSTISKFL